MARGLGKGVSALFGEENIQNSESSLTQIKIADIEANQKQPRRNFDEEALSGLSESIRQNGVISPITVRRLQNGFYQIIAGERRWRASRMAGLIEIPAIVIEADELKTMEIALVENLQREDLSPFEEAEGYRMLMENFELTQEEVSRRVGKSRPAVANALRLLKLPEAVKQMVSDGRLSAAHARTVLSARDERAMIKLATEIVRNTASVRDAERMAKKSQEKSGRAEAKRKISVNYLEQIERRLEAATGRRVKIVAGRDKGRVELEYYGNADLDRLVDALCKLNK